MKKGNNKGFSLIELIIVIAIMAVLLAIIAPNLIKYLGKSRIQVDNTNLEEVKKQTENCIAEAVIDEISIMASAGTAQAVYTVVGNGSDVSVTRDSGGTAEFAGLLKSMFEADLNTKSRNGKGDYIKVTIKNNASSGYTVQCEFTNLS